MQIRKVEQVFVWVLVHTKRTDEVTLCPVMGLNDQNFIIRIPHFETWFRRSTGRTHDDWFEIVRDDFDKLKSMMDDGWTPETEWPDVETQEEGK